MKKITKFWIIALITVICFGAFVGCPAEPEEEEEEKIESGEYSLGYYFNPFVWDHVEDAQDFTKHQKNQAVWVLSAANVKRAQYSGVKFEFAMPDVDDIDKIGHLNFAWASNDLELWWEDDTVLYGWEENSPGSGEYTQIIGQGVSWDDSTKNLSINLGSIIKENKFYNAKELNFVITCWAYNDVEWDENNSINTLGITEAFIVIP